jgi:hypothetical protein
MKINSPRALRDAAFNEGWKAGYSAAKYWAARDEGPGSLFPEFIAQEAASNWFGLRGRGNVWLSGFWQGVEFCQG